MRPPSPMPPGEERLSRVPEIREEPGPLAAALYRLSLALEEDFTAATVALERLQL